MTGRPRALSLGFIPLTDAAPLIVAAENGYFADEGLDVTLSREASWATVRDKVVTGVLDGAHMLAPMVLASTLGADFPATPLIAPLALNRGGAAVTVSNALADAMGAADPVGALRRVVSARRAEARGPLTLAVVYPFSIHNDLLRDWLAKAGAEVGTLGGGDIRIVVTPPPRMVEQLAAGRIDGFCAGAPWNDHAVDQSVGEIVLRAPPDWSGGSDKVLGLREAWANDHPDIVLALIKAVLRGAAWADEPRRRRSLAQMLSSADYVGAAPEIIARALNDEIVFHRDGTSAPQWRHAEAYVAAMIARGQVSAATDIPAVARRVWRPDLLHDAYDALDWPWPTI